MPYYYTTIDGTVTSVSIDSATTSVTSATITASSTGSATWYGDFDTVSYRFESPTGAVLRNRAWSEEEAAEERERQERLAAADKKAEQWMKSHLNPEQKEEYERKREITVYSKDRKRQYQIDKLSVYEVDEKGHKLRSFCIHPSERLPKFDEMCIKKVLLENNEAEFLRIANATQLRNIPVAA